MGVYTGVFNVVDGSDLSATTAARPVPTKSASGGGTCGASGGGCGCGGGGKQITPSQGTVSLTPATGAASSQKVQNINSSFTVREDIVPNTFKVKAGVPVHYVIDAKEDGVGCMSTVTIPGLYQSIFRLTAGQPIVMDFTPSQPGTYLIACAMGVPHGRIVVE
jgi:hypothetical protein